jgi:hypothetical protein
MKSILAVFLVISVCSTAFASQDWLGKPWTFEKLHCPFGCSKGMKEGFSNSKSKEVVFESERAILPEIMAACILPAKPMWSSVLPVQMQ